MTLLRYRRLVTPLLAVLLLGAAASASAGEPRAGAPPAAVGQAAAYLPPPEKVFTGLTDGPVSAYESAVGKHPAVFDEFIAWGQWLPGITAGATWAHARLMLSITTAYGSHEAITPQGMADGAGDAWLIGLNQAIYASHDITYVRLMSEMDNDNNPYCAYGPGGFSRGPSHSAREYKLAWKRATLILRGGSLQHIDAVLRRLGLPRLRYGTDLPKPPVAMMWVPMVASNAGPGPAAYWPGRAWVDWVGTDFYSKFPNFAGLNAFAAQFPGLPFVFGEYAIWGGDNPAFVRQLFSWVLNHPQVRMMVYNQGAMTDGPFRLLHFPLSAAVLRAELANPRFLAYAPEWVR